MRERETNRGKESERNKREKGREREMTNKMYRNRNWRE